MAGGNRNDSFHRNKSTGIAHREREPSGFVNRPFFSSWSSWLDDSFRTDTDEGLIQLLLSVIAIACLQFIGHQLVVFYFLLDINIITNRRHHLEWFYDANLVVPSSSIDRRKGGPSAFTIDQLASVRSLPFVCLSICVDSQLNKQEAGPVRELV